MAVHRLDKVLRTHSHTKPRFHSHQNKGCAPGLTLKEAEDNSEMALALIRPAESSSVAKTVTGILTKLY